MQRLKIRGTILLVNQYLRKRMLLVWMLMYQRLLNEDVSKFNVTKVDVGKYFITKLMFMLRDHKLQLIYVKQIES